MDDHKYRPHVRINVQTGDEAENIELAEQPLAIDDGRQKSSIQDHGWQAWTVLISVCAISMTTWGFGAAFGIFRDYYMSHPPFAGIQVVTEIGVMQLGIMQVLCPVILHWLVRRRSSRKPIMFAGTILLVVAAIGAAYSNTTAAIILTQGMLYGCGSALLFAASISLIEKWFLRRRGLASGLFSTSNSLAAAVYAPVFSRLLESYGHQTVLIGWAIFAGCVTFMAVLVTRSLEPGKQKHDKGHSRTSYTRPRYWIIALSVALQGHANFLPAAYLPSFATSLGVSISKAATLLSILQLASMVGQARCGLLVDPVGCLTPLLFSTTLSSMTILVVWGLGREYWTMVLFALAYGLFSSGYVVLRSHMAMLIINDTNRSEESTVLSGTLIAIRGVACVVSGFVGAAAASMDAFKGVQTGYGAGTWQSLIICTSVLMGTASIGALAYVC